MKAYEFPAQITADGTLQIPVTMLPSLPSNQAVRVIVLVDESPDSSEQQSWSQLTTEQFLAGYSAVDAIYDEP